MAKRIVFCSDGTWQAPLNNTNVRRLYTALLQTDDQVASYDDGVGADAKGFDRVWDAATGAGLLEKVLAGYKRIAELYEPGDPIYLFGFSRGAFTARSLGGFIASCGLPAQPVTDDCVAKAFAAYRDPANRKGMLAAMGACRLQEATIEMVGVWDTVGALGVPALQGGIDQGRFGFLDTALHPCIRNGYHALAIDEQRRQFPATLWTSAPGPGQTIEQVWFSGCHCDVGGGTPPGVGVDDGTRLCDITLAWMLGKARAHGLTMNAAAEAEFVELPQRYALDRFLDSWAALPIGPPSRRPVPADASLANSVALRVQYMLGDYAPPNLKIEEGAIGGGYAIVAVVDEAAL